MFADTATFVGTGKPLGIKQDEDQTNKCSKDGSHAMTQIYK